MSSFFFTSELFHKYLPW
ncbi:hypothetical protein Pint_14706 [Pistacia integerrima]|uniref:Uncharacterized protein n=1 Tax=Pistacia integerrima TaxID=434235 RepID=A0ACC0Y5R5_9ROSI|nr:hypothetical protein Pint_14706 [Pistacia integerrima]